MIAAACWSAHDDDPRKYSLAPSLIAIRMPNNQHSEPKHHAVVESDPFLCEQELQTDGGNQAALHIAKLRRVIMLDRRKVADAHAIIGGHPAGLYLKTCDVLRTRKSCLAHFQCKSSDACFSASS